MANTIANAQELIKTGNNMKITNFYLDDYTRAKVEQKLLLMDLSTKAFAATIRTLLRYFCDNDIPGIREQIEKEVVLCKKKNKRSKL